MVKRRFCPPFPFNYNRPFTLATASVSQYPRSADREPIQRDRERERERKRARERKKTCVSEEDSIRPHGPPRFEESPSPSIVSHCLTVPIPIPIPASTSIKVNTHCSLISGLSIAINISRILVETELEQQWADDKVEERKTTCFPRQGCKLM